jgi:hypothetical protein
MSVGGLGGLGEGLRCMVWEGAREGGMEGPTTVGAMMEGGVMVGDVKEGGTVEEIDE